MIGAALFGAARSRGAAGLLGAPRSDCALGGGLIGLSARESPLGLFAWGVLSGKSLPGGGEGDRGGKA